MALAPGTKLIARKNGLVYENGESGDTSLVSVNEGQVATVIGFKALDYGQKVLRLRIDNTGERCVIFGSHAVENHPVFRRISPLELLAMESE